jgi:hypothetical protein
MKKILFTLTLFGLITFSTPVLAQQQINNDGASGSDLQQQVGSDYFQQNSGGQQTSGVSDNAGASVIQNAPNQPLEVTGAPANTSTDESKSSLRWVIIFAAFFLILLSPALLYVRDMQKKGEITDDILVMKAPKEDTKAAKEDVEEVKEPKKSEDKPTKKKSTKAKKSTASKAKRGKKKK